MLRVALKCPSEFALLCIKCIQSQKCFVLEVLDRKYFHAEINLPFDSEMAATCTNNTLDIVSYLGCSNSH